MEKAFASRARIVRFDSNLDSSREVTVAKRGFGPACKIERVQPRSTCARLAFHAGRLDDSIAWLTPRHPVDERENVAQRLTSASVALSSAPFAKVIGEIRCTDESLKVRNQCRENRPPHEAHVRSSRDRGGAMRGFRSHDIRQSAAAADRFEEFQSGNTRTDLRQILELTARN